MNALSLVGSRLRRLLRPMHRSDGQALVLFAFGLIVFCGFVAMSIDVGRLVWARTQMQAAVDAAALGGAGQLPSQPNAINEANYYWDDNAQFIINQGDNVALNVDFPTNQRVRVAGEADLPTWFARIFGVDHWHVTAEGTAETIVLDTMIVMDRSGSMCWENHNNYQTFMRTDESVSAFETDIRVQFDPGETLATSAFVGQRITIQGNNEVMEIVALNFPDEIVVQRNISGGFDTHNSGRRISGGGNNECYHAGPEPFYPWQYVQDGAKLYIDQMNFGYDRVGYAPYSSNAFIHTGLTNNFPGLKNSIDNAPVPAGTTNIANGIGIANARLVNTGRVNAEFVIVLVTDGVGNTRCTGSDQVENCPNASTSESNADARTLQQADWAADHEITIYTVGYGPSSNYNEGLLEEIAERTNGQYFAAPDPDSLEAAFIEIANITRVRLAQ